MMPWSVISVRLLDGLLCLLVASFLLAINLLGTYRFSVDSWSYIELADTLRRGDPYFINTIRSYWGSPSQSASFPFGFPTLLAVARAWMPSPLSGVYLNIGLAGMCALAMIRLALLIGTTPALARVAAIICLLNPYFIDEVLAARSMPLALALLLWALVWSFHASASRKSMFLSGCLLGLSCLTRFDFLPLAAGWLAVQQIYRPGLQRLLITAVALLSCMSPWLFYSLVFFDTLWVSDNGWVAVTAVSSHAMDFPETDRLSASMAPLAWIQRIANNYTSLWLYLFDAFRGHLPSLFCVVSLLAATILLPGIVSLKMAMACGAWVALTLMPLALTGYHDERYFIPAMTLVTWAGTSVAEKLARPWLYGLLTLLLLHAVQQHVKHDLRRPWKAQVSIQEQSRTLQQNIAQLKRLQAANAGIRLAFRPSAHSLGAAFGAMTGQHAALLPYNHDRLTPEDLDSIHRRLGPFLIVDDYNTNLTHF